MNVCSVRLLSDTFIVNSCFLKSFQVLNCCTHTYCVVCLFTVILCCVEGSQSIVRHFLKQSEFGGVVLLFSSHTLLPCQEKKKEDVMFAKISRLFVVLVLG